MNKVNTRAKHVITALCMGLVPAMAAAQGVEAVTGPLKTDRYQATYVQLGTARIDGLLFEPAAPGPNARVALVYSNPLNIGFLVPASELANRGYRVLYVTHHAGGGRSTGLESPLDGFEETSRAITYMRSLPGVERVVIVGWGSGAVTMSFYDNVAEHGPTACQGAEVLYPCKTSEVSGLAKPDGVILLDPGLGPGDKARDVDPAYDGNSRSRADLDMFSAANGYDSRAGTATYSADFRKRFYGAQSERNDKIIDDAVARLKLIDQGKGNFPGDEPFLIPGTSGAGSGASLHQSDLSIMSHTRQPHMLLKPDGSSPVVILQSIRSTTGPAAAKSIGRAGECCNYTVRRFLANDAVRTTKDFAVTDDDVIGVDWKSSMSSPPTTAEGITVPSLVVTTTCFQFVVASEIVYDHLASKDKTLVGVEGAEHFMTACAPQYGDPRKREFDFVDGWLAKPGRF